MSAETRPAVRGSKRHALAALRAAALAALGVTILTAVVALPCPALADPVAPAVPPDPKTPAYWLEADVTMRLIPVGVSFHGARLVIFGSANRSGPAAADARGLDIVAVIQGTGSNLMVRRKSRVWGLWINTRSVEFDHAPKYYAVASTRALGEIASKAVLAGHGIGFDDVPIAASPIEAAGLNPGVLDEFRAAAIDLGIRDHAYVRDDHGITFAGNSLFRGEFDLPANIPLGALDVKVYLFRDGELLALHNSHLTLEREGFENFIYSFAHQHGWAYGIATVALAVLVGLLSSVVVSRRPR